MQYYFKLGLPYTAALVLLHTDTGVSKGARQAAAGLRRGGISYPPYVSSLSQVAS